MIPLLGIRVTLNRDPTQNFDFGQADILYNENSILYNFDISLHPGESYEGISEIKFNIPQNDFSEGEFFLDFQGKDVDAMIVNSEKVENCYKKDEGKIYLNNKYLKKG